MNIKQVSEDVFRFRAWNILSPNEVGLDGHYTIWWRTDGKWVIGFHGGYGGLTWHPKGDDVPGHPTASQRAFLEPKIDKEIRYARFWKHYSSGGTVNNEGDWLFPDTQKRHLSGEYIQSTRTVFDMNHLPDLNEIGDTDRQAIELLKECV